MLRSHKNHPVGILLAIFQVLQSYKSDKKLPGTCMSRLIGQIPYRLCFYARIIKKVKTFWPKNAPSNGERVVILLVTTRTILEHMRIITQKRIITKRE